MRERGGGKKRQEGNGEKMREIDRRGGKLRIGGKGDNRRERKRRGKQ